LDELDRKLIIQLYSNSRQSNRQLAMNLEVDEATIRRRIRYLVSSGAMILTALPDLTTFGLPVRGHLVVRADHTKIEQIGEQLCQIPCLRFIARCAGSADMVIRGDFESLDSMMNLVINNIGKIEGVSFIETMIECQRLKFVYNRVGITSFSEKPKPEKEIKLSSVDHQLILLLQKDARSPLKELAQQIGVSNATISRRIRDLVNAGVITLSAITDNTKVGYPIRCSVRIETDPSRTMEVAKLLTQYPQVTYVALVSGPIQILAGMQLISADELSDFVDKELNKIRGTVRIEVLTYLKLLKRHLSWLQE